MLKVKIATAFITHERLYSMASLNSLFLKAKPLQECKKAKKEKECELKKIEKEREKRAKQVEKENTNPFKRGRALSPKQYPT